MLFRHNTTLSIKFTFQKTSSFFRKKVTTYQLELTFQISSLLKCFCNRVALTPSDGGVFAPDWQKASLGYTLTQVPHL